MNVGVDPSKVVISKLKMDKDRKAILERKQVGGLIIHECELCSQPARFHGCNLNWKRQ